MKKTLQIANGIAFIITVIVNYLSNTGIFNGNTMKTISDLYRNHFTPAGYAFSIWGLIYIGLAGFVIYTGRSLFKKQVVDDDIVLKIGWWFVISCIANCLWIVTWLNNLISASVVIMICILFSLLQIIIRTNMEINFHPFKKYLFIFWPFAIYAGWITVALVANSAAWLTSIGWDRWGLSETTWTIIMIVVTGVVNVFMIWKRNLREYALVGIWGLIAVAVANYGNTTAIASTCFIVAAVIFVNIAFNKYKNGKTTLRSM